MKEKRDRVAELEGEVDVVEGEMNHVAAAEVLADVLQRRATEDLQGPQDHRDPRVNRVTRVWRDFPVPREIGVFPGFRDRLG